PAPVGLQEDWLQADLVEKGGDVLGRGTLTGPGIVPVVGRVDPDQVAAQGGDLVFGGHGRVRWVLGHVPIVAPAAPSGPAAHLARRPSGGPFGAPSGRPRPFAAGCRICYRDAADTGSAVLRRTSGWRNWQTR